MFSAWKSGIILRLSMQMSSVYAAGSKMELRLWKQGSKHISGQLWDRLLLSTKAARDVSVM